MAHEPTNSWLYVPLILDAVGMPLHDTTGRPSRPIAHHFLRPEGYRRLCAALTTVFQTHQPPITLTTLHQRYGLDAQAYIPAEFQEALLDMDIHLGQATMLYARWLASQGRTDAPVLPDLTIAPLPLELPGLPQHPHN